MVRSFADLKSFGKGAIAYCDFIDLSVSVTDGDDDWPTEWLCSEGGGSRFEWVHADYNGSGLKARRSEQS